MDASIRSGIEQTAFGPPFTLRNPEALSAFFQKHPGISRLVRAAAERLPNYFPGDPLVLEVEVDPEGAQVDTLFLIVRTPQAPREAIATLYRFDREWWLPTKARHRVPVVVTIEPVQGVRRQGVLARC